MIDRELVRVMRSVICRRLSAAEAEGLASVMVPRKVTAGSLICREGNETAGLMILLRGTGEVSKGGPASTQQLAKVEAPTVLGEVSLVLLRGKYSATVRAQTDCDLWVLPKTDFVQLLEKENVAVFKLVATLAEVLARRLVAMDTKMMEMARRGDHPAPVEELTAYRQKLAWEWTSPAKATE
jgi:CRP-like cAMP-binding protein